MSIKRLPIFGTTILLRIAFILFAQPISAQTEEQLVLRLSRDFGYSSGTGSIEGTFSMRASGPQSLTRVEFFIDDQSIGEDSEAPFALQFRTSSYPLGVHTLSAQGFTADSRILQSNQIRAEFVTAGEGMKAAGRIIIPILVIIAVAMLISFAIPMLTGRGKEQLAPGTPRKYGVSGGTICPKCGRPFSIHFFGLNLLVGKLDRCPHCGRWSVVRAYPLSALRAAEEVEKAQAAAPEPELLSEEERLRRDLDSSRYEDV